jgi:hypothetical protein
MITLINDSEITIQGRAMRYLSARLRHLIGLKRKRRLTRDENDELLSLLTLARHSGREWRQ